MPGNTSPSLTTNIYKEVLDKIIIICPTFPRNKTYQNEEFIFRDTNILVCDCDFDDVEQYIKISRCFINCKPSIENALIIFDDIVCSKDILKQTSEITKLSFSGRHENISFILITQDFHTIPKKFGKIVQSLCSSTMQIENKWIQYLISILDTSQSKKDIELLIFYKTKSLHISSSTTSPHITILWNSVGLKALNFLTVVRKF